MNSKGVIYGIAAFVLWGMFPIYWSELNDIDPYELLFHRVFWLLICIGGYLLISGKFKALIVQLKDKNTLIYMLFSSLLIGTNWFFFIWGVQVNRVSEVSLGYYVNPLVNVVFGLLFFKEKLRKGQLPAIIIAIISVSYLAFYMGNLPWLSLMLALTFGFYGVVRKLAPVGATEGLFIEAFTVLVFLSVFFISIGKFQDLDFFHISLSKQIYLSFAGIVTFTPLFLFVSSAKLIPLSIVGFLQFIAPTLHFLCAKYYLGESFPLYKDISFVMIWGAVFCFLLELYMNFRRSKKVLL